MAGEDFLDMSLISYNPPEDEQIIEQEIEQETQEQINEPVNKEEKITDDAVKGQENVGEKVEEKSKDNEDVNTESPADSDKVLFKALATSLQSRGLFSTLEKDIETEEDLVEAFKSEIKKSEFAQLNGVQKEYLEALESGIPHEVISAHQQTEAIFENITDDILDNDADVRKQVIVQERLAGGWTTERAERDFKRIQDLGDELEEAKLCRDNLKVLEQKDYQFKVESVKKQEVEREKVAKERLDELKQAVFKEENFLGSLKVDEGLKARVYESMTKPVAYDELGNPINKLMKHRMDNPVDFETKLYWMYELTKGFTDISKFINKATSAASKELRNAIKGSTLIKSSGGGLEENLPDENDYSSPIVDVQL